MLTKFTLFRCPEDLIEKAKTKAARDRRSLSNYLITLIEKNVADVVLSANGKAPGKTPVRAKAVAPAKLKAASAKPPKVKPVAKPKPASKAKAKPKAKSKSR